MRAFFVAIFCWLCTLPAAAQTVVDSPEADESYLTIYPDNLAMVTEVRKVTVPAGISTIRFLGVSDQIIAQTAVLQSFEGVSLESNFDSDLITKGALLNRSVGEHLKITRVNSETGDKIIQDVTLISASNNSEYIQGAVFETEDGVEALDCSGMFEALAFSGLPGNLHSTPVLSVQVRSENGGDSEISLSYLTQGIGWQADYRLDAPEGKNEGRLSGWLTITNSTSKSFKDAPTAIIAGKINRDFATKADAIKNKNFLPTCWAQGRTEAGTPIDPVLYKMTKLGGGYGDEVMVTGSRLRQDHFGAFAPAPVAMEAMAVQLPEYQAKQEDFGDYKLYRTPLPVTVAAQQTKQIAFLNVPNVEFERVYKFDYRPRLLPHNIHSQPQRMRLEIEIDNSKDGSLAKPLPKGTMRVMTLMPNGKSAFLGEDNVRDLAIDLPVEVAISESSSVMIVPSASSQGNEGKLTLSFRAGMLNSMPKPVMVEVKIDTNFIRKHHIVDASHRENEDEIIPEYKFEIGSESQEEFFIELGLYYRSRIIHRLINYEWLEPDELDEDPEDRYLADYSNRETGFDINLPGQSGNNSEITRHLSGRAEMEITFDAELISLEEVSTETGDKLTVVSEVFYFTNRGTNRAEIAFNYAPGSYELLSSSISPDPGDRLMWTVFVDVGETAELKVMTKGAHRF